MRLSRHPRRVLVLGGARSGKSSYAESLVRGGTIEYLACGPVPDAGDPEWAERVARHRQRRPASWRTVETLDAAGLLDHAGPDVLLDCVSTWLSGVMDECGVWSSTGGSPGSDGPDARLAGRIAELTGAWRSTPRRVVAVSNEVGSSVVPATASGRRYRDELGTLNAALAATADRVWLVTAGIPVRLK